MNPGSRLSRALLAAVFVTAGTLHFLFPGGYVRIMPPYLPLHRELVYLSGALEIAGGVGVLIERTRRVAALGLILLLLAVWPANLQMVLGARAAGAPSWWEALLWARLPLQLLLVAWVWRVYRPRTP
ncbi:MAG: DoxX family membrane protein [Gemmatimonadota bacterium]|nr:DoxX family membrane protein [Gemmatimonadota bacterium]